MSYEHELLHTTGWGFLYHNHPTCALTFSLSLSLSVYIIVSLFECLSFSISPFLSPITHKASLFMLFLFHTPPTQPCLTNGCIMS